MNIILIMLIVALAVMRALNRAQRRPAIRFMGVPHGGRKEFRSNAAKFR